MSHRLTPRLRAWQAAGEYLAFRGQRVFVRRAGSGPVLLLVHGYPTGSYDWHRVWDTLAKTHTVVAVDMLGLGLSDKPLHHPYRIADHADLHDWLLTHLGIGDCTLLAHDLGVTVAQEMLARRAEHAVLPRVERLVLLNGGLVPEAYRPRAIQRLLASPVGGWVGPRIGRAAFEVSLQPLFTPEHMPTRALLDDLWTLVTHNDGLQVAHRVGRFWRERMAFSERLLRPLVEGHVPTLLINGAQDPNSGWHMVQSFLQRVPGTEVVRLDDAGHWPQFDRPEVVVEHILRSDQPALMET